MWNKFWQYKHPNTNPLVWRTVQIAKVRVWLRQSWAGEGASNELRRLVSYFTLQMPPMAPVRVFMSDLDKKHLPKTKRQGIAETTDYTPEMEALGLR